MREKYFLLIAGHGYYPQSGTDDWIGTYSTYEEAKSKVEYIEDIEVFSRGPRKGEKKSSSFSYQIDGRRLDWFEIIDLREWINRNN